MIFLVPRPSASAVGRDTFSFFEMLFWLYILLLFFDLFYSRAAQHHSFLKNGFFRPGIQRAPRILRISSIDLLQRITKFEIRHAFFRKPWSKGWVLLTNY